LFPFSKSLSDQEVLFSGDSEVEVDVIKVVAEEVWEALAEGDGVVKSVFEAVAVHEVRIAMQTKLSKIGKNILFILNTRFENIHKN